jgi:predicted ester cyclase
LNLTMNTELPRKPDSRAAVVRSVFTAIFSGDSSPFESHPGLESLKKAFPPMLTAFPDFHAELKQQLVDGDHVASQWIFRGTHRGPFYGIAATGKPVEFQNISICRVVDGRIVSYNSEIGALRLLTQIGALPASHAARPAPSQEAESPNT